MNYTKEQLDEASGFEPFQFVRFPYLKFIAAESSKSQGEVKDFILLRNDEEGKLIAENLGKEVRMIFISRGKFKLRKASWTTNEIIPGKDVEVELFKVNKSTGKKHFQEIGKWREIKERYGLATFQYPYVLLNGEIVKMAILPSSLNNYWEYCDSFKSGEKIYEYETILKGSKKAKESEGGVYYQIDFEKGKKVENLDFVAGKIMELKEIREQQEKARQLALEEKQAPIEISDDEIPVIEDEQ